MRCAGEEVSRGVIASTAFRTGRRNRSADPIEVGVKGRAVARSKLGKGRTVSSRKIFVRNMNRRGGEIQDVGILARVNSAADIVGVDSIFNVIVVVRRDDIVDKIGLNIINERRAESVFHITWTRGRDDKRMEWVRWARGASQILS